MPRWSDLQDHAPAMAAIARELLDRFEVVILGTTSESGSARLSLVEPRIVGRDLVIGTMSDDRKSADLRRQPGCSIHTPVTHRTHDEAVFKATVRSEEVTGPRLEVVAAELARPEIDWRPTAVFALDIERAVLIERGGATAWP